jgi:hypothetical protein
MTWTATVAFEDATGKVRLLYERIKGPDEDGDIIGLSPTDGEDMDNWNHQ